MKWFRVLTIMGVFAFVLLLIQTAKAENGAPPENGTNNGATWWIESADDITRDDETLTVGNLTINASGELTFRNVTINVTNNITVFGTFNVNTSLMNATNLLINNTAFESNNNTYNITLLNIDDTVIVFDNDTFNWQLTANAWTVYVTTTGSDERNFTLRNVNMTSNNSNYKYSMNLLLQGTTGTDFSVINFSWSNFEYANVIKMKGTPSRIDAFVWNCTFDDFGRFELDDAIDLQITWSNFNDSIYTTYASVSITSSLIFRYNIVTNSSYVGRLTNFDGGSPAYEYNTVRHIGYFLYYSDSGQVSSDTVYIRNNNIQNISDELFFQGDSRNTKDHVHIKNNVIKNKTDDTDPLIVGNLRLKSYYIEDNTIDHLEGDFIQTPIAWGTLDTFKNSYIQNNVITNATGDFIDFQSPTGTFGGLTIHNNTFYNGTYFIKAISRAEGSTDNIITNNTLRDLDGFATGINVSFEASNNTFDVGYVLQSEDDSIVRNMAFHDNTYESITDTILKLDDAVGSGKHISFSNESFSTFTICTDTGASTGDSLWLKFLNVTGSGQCYLERGGTVYLDDANIDPEAVEAMTIYLANTTISALDIGTSTLGIGQGVTALNAVIDASGVIVSGDVVFDNATISIVNDFTATDIQLVIENGSRIDMIDFEVDPSTVYINNSIINAYETDYTDSDVLVDNSTINTTYFNVTNGALYLNQSLVNVSSMIQSSGIWFVLNTNISWSPLATTVYTGTTMDDITFNNVTMNSTSTRYRITTSSTNKIVTITDSNITDIESLRFTDSGASAKLDVDDTDFWNYTDVFILTGPPDVQIDNCTFNYSGVSSDDLFYWDDSFSATKFVFNNNIIDTVDYVLDIGDVQGAGFVANVNWNNATNVDDFYYHTGTVSFSGASKINIMHNEIDTASNAMVMWTTGASTETATIHNNTVTNINSAFLVTESDTLVVSFNDITSSSGSSFIQDVNGLTGDKQVYNNTIDDINQFFIIGDNFGSYKIYNNTLTNTGTAFDTSGDASDSVEIYNNAITATTVFSNFNVDGEIYGNTLSGTYFIRTIDDPTGSQTALINNNTFGAFSDAIVRFNSTLTTQQIIQFRDENFGSSTVCKETGTYPTRTVTFELSWIVGTGTCKIIRTGQVDIRDAPDIQFQVGGDPETQVFLWNGSLKLTNVTGYNYNLTSYTGDINGSVLSGMYEVLLPNGTYDDVEITGGNITVIDNLTLVFVNSTLEIDNITIINSNASFNESTNVNGTSIYSPDSTIYYTDAYIDTSTIWHTNDVVIASNTSFNVTNLYQDLTDWQSYDNTYQSRSYQPIVPLDFERFWSIDGTLSLNRDTFLFKPDSQNQKSIWIDGTGNTANLFNVSIQSQNSNDFWFDQDDVNINIYGDSVIQDVRTLSYHSSVGSIQWSIANSSLDAYLISAGTDTNFRLDNSTITLSGVGTFDSLSLDAYLTTFNATSLSITDTITEIQRSSINIVNAIAIDPTYIWINNSWVNATSITYDDTVLNIRNSTINTTWFNCTDGSWNSWDNHYNISRSYNTNLYWNSTNDILNWTSEAISLLRSYDSNIYNLTMNGSTTDWSILGNTVINYSDIDNMKYINHTTGAIYLNNSQLSNYTAFQIVGAGATTLQIFNVTLDSPTTGIVFSNPDNLNAVLNQLTIQSSDYGINISETTSLEIIDLLIEGGTTGITITEAVTTLTLNQSTINNTNTGITSGFAVLINDTTLTNNTYGILITANLDVRNCTLDDNDFGIYYENGPTFDVMDTNSTGNTWDLTFANGTYSGVLIESDNNDFDNFYLSNATLNLSQQDVYIQNLWAYNGVVEAFNTLTVEQEWHMNYGETTGNHLYINGSSTYTQQNGTLWIDGNITVNQNGRYNLYNSTIYFDNDYDSENNLLVYGRLEAMNSTITAIDPNYQWSFYFYDGSIGRLWDGTKVTFVDNSSASSHGIFCTGSATVYIEDIIVTNSDIGVYANYTTNLTMNETQIYNVDIGIMSEHSTVDINNLSINDTDKGMWFNASTIDLNDGDYFDNNYTIVASSSNGVVQNVNIYDNAKIGIYLVGSSPYINFSTIDHNFIGIQCKFSSSPYISNNTIANSTRDGVRTRTNSQPVLRYNRIKDNTNFGVNNLDSGVTVDATYNDWREGSVPTQSGTPPADCSLNVDCSHPLLPPYAGTYVDLDGQVGLPVFFTFTGVGATVEWDFGDGHTAIGEHVFHIYSSAGTYTVTVTVTTGPDQDSTQLTVTITEIDTRDVGKRNRDALSNMFIAGFIPAVLLLVIFKSLVFDNMKKLKKSLERK